MPSTSNRPPCRGCHRPTKRKAGVCLDCDPTVPDGRRRPDAKRPERACVGECGKRTTAKTGMCRTCTGEGVSPAPPKAEHALKGAMVQRGLVWVWDPTATPCAA